MRAETKSPSPSASPSQVLDPESAHLFRDMTLGQYLRLNGYSHAFTHNYVIPMCAAVWSVPSAEVTGEGRGQ